MKKISFLFVAIAAMLLFAAPAWSQWATYYTLSFDDSLRSAATADTVWSQAISIEGCDYVAFNLKITRVSAGGAGAAILAVQGLPKYVTFSSASAQVPAWQNLFVTDFGDSNRTVNTWALSGTSDIYKNFTAIPTPYQQNFQATVNDAQYPRVFVTAPLPFAKIRLRIIDTNWTIRATCTGNVKIHRME
jgi:hypothetical protein